MSYHVSASIPPPCRRYELSHTLDVINCSQVLLQQRTQVVHLALKYGAAFSFKDDTIYDGLQLFDRVACLGLPAPVFNVNAWPLCLCSCILLAAHQGEPSHIWPTQDTVTMLTGFGSEALGNSERNIFTWLQQVRRKTGERMHAMQLRSECA